MATLGTTGCGTKYDPAVAGVQKYLVSSSGQLSLPAAARHRWKLDHGGPVDVIDLGFAVMALPQGQARRLLNDLLPRDEHAEYVASLAEDPDLATT
jgi:bifunctional DNA-binding transcriptional regulator/antitoxin component of YhaV-PrlF toxin-antitoxin module